MPAELEPVLEQFMQQIREGENEPSLNRKHRDLLLQRYVHYSANYNGFETLIGKVPVRVRLFRHLRPNVPASSRERLVYPQREGA